MAKEKKLEVKDLVVSFSTVDGKVQAVRDISFDLHKGETLAIVGESGSGKSVTSKAIIGISSPNALIESGEIIYDGQDLLRITEEDFHKIRGDKIAMIFQDPLSSLNPIVKIGTQLTEAMILKNKASRKNCRKEFNQMLSDLFANINKAENNANVEENKTLAKKFDEFNIVAIDLENKYNASVVAGEEYLPNADDLLLKAEKGVKADFVKMSKSFVKDFAKCQHEYFITKEAIAPIIEKAKANHNDKNGFSLDVLVECVKAGKEAVLNAQKLTKPNYFTIGYYVYAHPEEDLSKYTVEELNKLSRKVLDDEFMLSFIDKAVIAMKQSDKDSCQGKRDLIDLIANHRHIFEKETLDKKECSEAYKTLCAGVEASIDKLVVVKDSLAYTFKYSFKGAIDKYFDAVKNNPKEQAKYEKSKAQWEKLASKGKTPDWKVTPPAIIDLELTRKTILMIFDRLVAKYETALQDEAYDYQQGALNLVEFFKEKARGVVDVVTPARARAKALKLMEEVGIPEPAARFKQYPFEFSGGMRQRIVIAIALAANPDILICDEPTTALDVTIQAQILELINRIKAERNLSIIFITHDLGVVANMADRIAVMYAGKIVEYGTDKDIFYNPKHPYTWALLASMPDLETKEKLEAIPGTPPNMIFPPIGDAFAARNKHALKIDFEQQPPLFKINDDHYAATWLLHPDAPKVDPPRIVTQRIARMKAKNQELQRVANIEEVAPAVEEKPAKKAPAKKASKKTEEKGGNQ